MLYPMTLQHEEPFGALTYHTPGAFHAIRRMNVADVIGDGP